MLDRKTKIILTRKKSMLNRLRGFTVLIDGQKVGSIKNGATEEFPVSYGTHKIECKINWAGSTEYEVNVREGESSYLQVRSGLKFFWILYIMILAVLGTQVYFIVNKKPFPPQFETIRWVALLLFFAYFIYYLTLGRKQYLVIEKDSSSIFNN